MGEAAEAGTGAGEELCLKHMKIFKSFYDSYAKKVSLLKLNSKREDSDKSFVAALVIPWLLLVTVAGGWLVVVQ